mmetsp:Transcript_22541/g.64857  ORF Transcript_22541/g.64857 Transcript_22541/m.64857 type:complete len:229 (+) Transcript_22541:338-1024(+)
MAVVQPNLSMLPPFFPDSYNSLTYLLKFFSDRSSATLAPKAWSRVPKESAMYHPSSRSSNSSSSISEMSCSVRGLNSDARPILPASLNFGRALALQSSEVRVLRTVSMVHRTPRRAVISLSVRPALRKAFVTTAVLAVPDRMERSRGLVSFLFSGSSRPSCTLRNGPPMLSTAAAPPRATASPVVILVSFFRLRQDSRRTSHAFLRLVMYSEVSLELMTAPITRPSGP